MNIVAEFADRYVWDYDGTPIQLYNDEPLDGISVSKGGEISFFAELEMPGDMFWLETTVDPATSSSTLKVGSMNLNFKTAKAGLDPELVSRPSRTMLTS